MPLHQPHAATSTWHGPNSAGNLHTLGSDFGEQRFFGFWVLGCFELVWPRGTIGAPNYGYTMIHPFTGNMIFLPSNDLPWHFPQSHLGSCVPNSALSCAQCQTLHVVRPQRLKTTVWTLVSGEKRIYRHGRGWIFYIELLFAAAFEGGSMRGRNINSGWTNPGWLLKRVTPK